MTTEAGVGIIIGQDGHLGQQDMVKWTKQVTNHQGRLGAVFLNTCACVRACVCVRNQS